ncbi:MAG: branched-chain amino acid aminotransferase [Planctomycetota bacterium]|nr:MAG: branched-chain amino acid aminotransferase [Planctomycetota bacterium]
MSYAAPTGFAYRPTPWRFQAEWDGSWSEGRLLSDPRLSIEEGATCLHYGQQCFEGLKAYAAPDGTPLLFRPEENARRMARSAERLLLPPPPEELFFAGVRACVRANRDHLPAHGSGASLYVRPVLLGVGDNLGLRPAPRAVFRVFCSPVGPYFADGLRGIRLLVSDEDRVAPRGLGAYKAGGNYAGGLLLAKRAKEQGYDEVLYLDAIEHRYLDEAGSANVYGVAGGTLLTPRSPSILPSITLASLLVLAEEELGLRVERRRVAIDEVADFEEMGCTGTAAVITPVASVRHGEQEWRLPHAPGPRTEELYRLLVGTQTGALPDPRGWRMPVS